MKTKEELNALKKEVEKLNQKLAELTEDELAQVIGGDMIVNHNMASINSMTTENQLPQGILKPQQ